MHCRPLQALSVGACTSGWRMRFRRPATPSLAAKHTPKDHTAPPVCNPRPPLNPQPSRRRDLWRLDLATHEWDRLPARGGPSARSGHRMALHKGRALLFGGFYDTGDTVKCV